MPQNDVFSRITIEPAINGYVISIETDSDEKKYVYQSLRIAMRELKKVMSINDPDND